MPASRQVERGVRFQRFEASAGLVQGGPYALQFASDRRQFGEDEEGQRLGAMVWRMGMLAPGGVQLAEEAVGGKEGERLARVGGMGETMIGVLARGAGGQ